MTKVSIIVPIHNAGEYLRPCLDSLLSQTLKEIEVVCVTDCPTDGSDAVADAYARQDPRVVVIHNTRNLNIGESRNVGMRHAQGVYIGFSDHDDTHHPDMYRQLWEQSDNGHRDVVLSGPLARQAERCGDKAPWDTVFCSLLGRRCTTHITPHIYRMAFLEEQDIHLVDNNLSSVEDTLFNLSVFGAMQDHNNFSWIPDELYYHRNTGKNTNLGYAHWAFDKVVYATNKAIAIAERQPHLGKDGETALDQFLVKGFYTSFLRERKQNGLRYTLKRFRQIKKEKTPCARRIHSASIFMTGITLPKRVFLAGWKLLV